MSSQFDWVEHDGLRFRCRLDGSGGNLPWIAFSNSMVTDLTVWDHQVEALADRFNILRYDQRGHGGTSVPSGPCTFDQLGGDAAFLLDHFGIESCTFVGLSMGVPTALHVYEHHPDRIRRLVLSDGQSKTAATGAQTWQARIEAARAGGMDENARITIERWFGADFIASGKAERVRAMAAAVPLEGYVACARALQDYDFAHVLANIAVPTLLVAGANDGNMPDSMRDLAASIRGAQFVEIPGAGHIPNWEQAELFNRHLSAFVDQS